MQKLDINFFQQDVLIVAPQLVGKFLVRKFADGTIIRNRITETEAYRGEEDLACHAKKGRTPRTEVLYMEGGTIYVYLIYGMYWLINFVTGPAEHPQAALIRGIEGMYGPGRLTRHLDIDKSFNKQNITTAENIWVENDDLVIAYNSNPRIGVDYAGSWAKMPWRFTMIEDKPIKKGGL